MSITEGQTGYLISAYALAGLLLTAYLSRFNKKSVLVFLMLLFVLGNIMSAMVPDYDVLMICQLLVKCMRA